MTRFATLLGACATVVVLAVTVAALVHGVRRPAQPSPDERPWQVVARPPGRFEVPPAADGWGLWPSSRRLYYADRNGAPLVAVAGPAVLDEGYCTRTTGPSNRAFAGLVGTRRGQAAVVHDRLVRDWVAAIGGRVEVSHREQVRLHGARAAVRSRAVLALTRRTPCQPRRVELWLVSAPSTAGVTTLVLVRDLGAGTVHLTPRVVDRLLSSLHPS